MRSVLCRGPADATRQPVRRVNRIRSFCRGRREACFGRDGWPGGSRPRTGTRSPDHRGGGGRGGVGLSPDSRGTGCPRAAVDGRRKDVAAERAWWRPAGRRQLDGREIKSRGVDRSISSDDRRVRVRQRSSDGHLPARGHCTIDGASTADDMSITTVRPTSTPLCPSRPESPQSHPPTLSFIRVAVIRLLIPVLTAITSSRLILVLENCRNI